MRSTFRNPILSGCYPDPSICRTGDDYYPVTSTIEYSPGLPICRSRDLVEMYLNMEEQDYSFYFANQRNDWFEYIGLDL